MPERITSADAYIGRTRERFARDAIRQATEHGWPIFAWIPMRGVDWEGLKFMEDPPVAYMDQMEAKRIADNARKRAKRNGGIDRRTDQWIDSTSVVGIAIRAPKRKEK